MMVWMSSYEILNNMNKGIAQVYSSLCPSPSTQPNPSLTGQGMSPAELLIKHSISVQMFIS